MYRLAYNTWWMYNSPYFKTHIFCNLLPIKNHLIKPVHRDHREDHKNLVVREKKPFHGDTPVKKMLVRATLYKNYCTPKNRN